MSIPRGRRSICIAPPKGSRFIWQWWGHFYLPKWLYGSSRSFWSPFTGQPVFSATWLHRWLDAESEKLKPPWICWRCGWSFFTTMVNQNLGLIWGIFLQRLPTILKANRSHTVITAYPKNCSTSDGLDCCVDCVKFFSDSVHLALSFLDQQGPCWKWHTCEAWKSFWKRKKRAHRHYTG